MKRLLLAFTSPVLALVGCSPDPHPDALRASAGTTVDSAAYNRQIEAAGLETMCPSGKCDQPALLISGQTPSYPANLLAARLSGHASIVFGIDEHGKVVDPRVESASRPEFAEASIQALRTWQFKPATLQGKPVPMMSRQNFPFQPY